MWGNAKNDGQFSLGVGSGMQPGVHMRMRSIFEHVPHIKMVMNYFKKGGKTFQTGCKRTTLNSKNLPRHCAKQVFCNYPVRFSIEA